MVIVYQMQLITHSLLMYFNKWSRVSLWFQVHRQLMRWLTWFKQQAKTLVLKLRIATHLNQVPIEHRQTKWATTLTTRVEMGITIAIWAMSTRGGLCWWPLMGIVVRDAHMRIIIRVGVSMVLITMSVQDRVIFMWCRTSNSWHWVWCLDFCLRLWWHW